MKEYIEREAAIKTINKLRIGLRTQGAYEFDLVAAEAKHRIESIPAADVVEARHGRWIDSEEDGHLSICGVCNYPVDRFYKTNYCPCCGARMDGGADK